MTSFVERPGGDGNGQVAGVPKGDAASQVRAEESLAVDGIAVRRRPLADSGVERRTWVPDAGCRIIACIDVEPVGTPAERTVRSDVLWELAVRRLERCIRPNDSMCMLGGNRFAVSFGNGGHRVPPSVLGRRLARALGDHLSVGPNGLDVHVAVGIAAGPEEVGAADLTEAALAAVRSARRQMAAAGDGTEPQAVVTVTHVPAGDLARPTAGPSRIGTIPGASPAVTRLSRRVVVPLTAAGDPVAPASIRQVTGTVPRVLVVDAEHAHGGAPRLAVEAVAAIARKLGARTTISPSSDPERVVLDLYVAEPHVAVVVLDSELGRRRSPGDALLSWERPARLVKALRNAGTPVIAIGMGASAVAVAACVEQGAVGLLDADELAHELASVVTGAAAPVRNGGAPDGTASYDSGARKFPAAFAPLVALTPSERRVLFHMMDGRAAAEIAEGLVVSLPTVRSHIRSILRKLNVNSQLAAVAIANGVLPDARAGV